VTGYEKMDGGERKEGQKVVSPKKRGNKSPESGFSLFALTKRDYGRGGTLTSLREGLVTKKLGLGNRGSDLDER